MFELFELFGNHGESWPGLMFDVGFDVTNFGRLRTFCCQEFVRRPRREGLWR